MATGKLVQHRGFAPVQSPRRNRRSTYRPKGIRYPSLDRAVEAVGTPTEHWEYFTPWTDEATWVLRFDKPDGSKKYRFITRFEDGWYVDLPEAPYPLYCKENLVEDETIYVFEGEKVVDMATQMWLAATTSLGGPQRAAMADWSPLEEKHVVIVRDFDEVGLKYAEEVAQLVLAVGAFSAKIVTLPGLNEGEDLIEWVEKCRTGEDLEVMKAELEAIALATPFVERKTVPENLPDGQDGSGRKLEYSDRTDQGKKRELFRAINWLTEQLSSGQVRSITLKIDAFESGFSDVTLRRAYHWLGGRATKEKVTNHWYWSLPEYQPVADGKL